MMFDRLCIIGVGLIGGSIARAARSHKLASRIVGYGREQEKQNLETAQRLGVIDEYFLDIGPALLDADGVVIAVPVGAIESVFALLKPYWSNGCVYSDVGSTKSSVIAAAERVFGTVPANLVPAHPIAGAENSGVESALTGLFERRRLIITPLTQTEAVALSKIQAFWKHMGAQVSIMSAEHHDAVLAATSHLPHLLAFALVDMLGRQDEQCEIFKYAAGGFRDFTRIASSDPTMWRDICVANKDQLIPLLHQLKTELERIEQLLVDNDGQRLFETFSYARNARQRFLEQLEN
jgi:prephenate dehydrogenase